MAIRVRYFEDTRECYTEGPFVMVNAQGWRIEVDNGGPCPVLPDLSIVKFLKQHSYSFGKTNDEELCVRAVDFLNRKVKDKTLVLDGTTWIDPFNNNP